MVRAAKLVGIMLFVIMSFASASMAFVGEEVLLGGGHEFRHDLNLEPGHKYNISITVQSSEPGVLAKLAVEFTNSQGQVEEFISTERGLGQSGRWTLVGLELTAPQKDLKAQLVLTTDNPGTYRWDSLTVQRLYETSNEVQKYWEDRFARYGAVYTGLVVDARHLNVRRGISPRIFSESGQLLYGGVLASSQFVQDVGVVAYGNELNPELIRRIQVDPNYGYALPLTVEAVGVIEPARTGVYIKDADAERILEALAQYDFFARYAVIFLID